MTAHNILYLYETAVGLGHQRRASGLVNAMDEAGFKVSVAAGTFVEPEKFFNPGIQLISLPANRRTKDGVICHYDEQNHLVQDEAFDWHEWQEDRAKAITPFAQSAPVSCIVAEWWPFKRRREFSNIIRTVSRQQSIVFGNKPLLISSVRDIQGGSFKKEDRDEALQIINSDVHSVLIHGDPNLITLEEVFPDPALLKKELIHTGYVVNPEALAWQDSPQKRNQTVIVSCGSGDEGHHLLNAAAKARPFSKLRDHQWVFVLGPRMEDHHQREFHQVVEAVGLGADIRPTMMELPQELCRTGFSISLAGYNTTMEVLASRAPSLMLPKFREEAGMIGKTEVEQWKRLVRLEECGMASIASPEKTLDPQSFASTIDAAYDRGEPPVRLNMNGAQNTAEYLRNLLNQQKQHLACA